MPTLAIRNFTGRYFLPGDAAERWHTQRRLDRVVSTRLPQALNDSLSQTVGDQVIYRIRNLHVRLWLDETVAGDSALATTWARLLAKAITEAIQNGSATNVVRYDSEAHFLAAFLSDLLAGRAWSRWMYDEFRPLQDVPVGRAAALLLSPQPELILPVAARLQTMQVWEKLLRQMDAADLQLIWEEGLGFTEPPPWIAPEDLPALPVDVPLEYGGQGAFARNRLRLFVALRRQAIPPAATTAAAISHHLALLAWFQQQSAARRLWPILAAGEIKSLAAIEQLLASGGSTGSLLQSWLAQVLPAAEGRTYLAQLVQNLTPEAAAAEKISPAKQIATAFAGLSLLLPAMRDLALYETVGAAGLYQLMLDAVGPRLRPLAWSDPAVAWLCGLQQDEAEAARKEEIAWPETDPALVGEAVTYGCQPASLWLMRHFTAGIRGMSTSSPSYLVDQVFHQPGYLLVDDESLEIYMSRSPLGVLLRMAGKSGEQGPLPWLNDRLLTIHLP